MIGKNRQQKIKINRKFPEILEKCFFFLESILLKILLTSSIDDDDVISIGFWLTPGWCKNIVVVPAAVADGLPSGNETVLVPTLTVDVSILAVCP